MTDRDFKGVWIPSEIWLDETLTALDKIILAEINSLDTEQGCRASNEYLADFCGCSISKVSKSISVLIKRGLVKVESFNGRYRVLRSCSPLLQGRLVNFTRQSSKKCEAGSQNLPPINIDDYINTSEDVLNKRFKAPSVEEVRGYCEERKNNINPQEFVDYYASKGWMIGKARMKDWKASVRLWESRRKSGKTANTLKTTVRNAEDFMREIGGRL